MNQLKLSKKIGFGVLMVALFTSANDPAPKPNIIFILADDLGFGDLECFNENCKISTPNLNRLAEEGIRFTNAHTTSAVCTPSRYGILTGRYNWRSGLKEGVLGGDAKPIIDSARLTVAGLLKKNGYHTAIIGKWHLGWNWQHNASGQIDFSKPVTGSPRDNGFDYSFNISASLDMAPYVFVENGIPTAIPAGNTGNDNASYAFWRNGPTAPDFVHDSITPQLVARSISYIKQQSQSGNPFFLYLTLTSPHAPILPVGEWKDKSGLNPYGDFVSMMDAYMGYIFKAVKELGIDKNTIIIFASDNGGAPVANYEVLLKKGHNPSYKFRGTKSDIYEGGHRVPFIIKWPGQIGKNQICSKNISLVDIMATCAGIVHAKFPDNAGEDSYNLLPLFNPATQHEYAREATVTHSNDGTFAITKDEWKLIFGPGSGGWSYPTKKDLAKGSFPQFQLYNLNNDLGETNNLCDSLPQKVLELKALMRKIITDGRSTPGIPQQNEKPRNRKDEWRQIDKIVN